MRSRMMMFALALIALGAVLSPQAVWAQGSVKIGFLYPDSGPFAQLGLDMRDGFLLYWSEVENRAGGRPVEVLLEAKGTNKPDERLTKAFSSSRGTPPPISSPHGTGARRSTLQPTSGSPTRMHPNISDRLPRMPSMDTWER